MISGIILSTGVSFHNGIAPALLKMGEKTYIRHIVDVLRSARITDIVIIDEAEKNKTVIFSPLHVFVYPLDGAGAGNVKSLKVIYDY
jgi:molybdopterin-guanine dinucleotide biosynthesis protein A